MSITTPSTNSATQFALRIADKNKPDIHSQGDLYKRWAHGDYLDHFQEYCLQVELYSAKALTNPGDILNAFQGIESGFFKYLGSKWFWGAPESYFHKSLMFMNVVRETHRAGFPSWSWAGWQENDSNLPSSVSYSLLTALHKEKQLSKPNPRNKAEGHWHVSPTVSFRSNIIWHRVSKGRVVQISNTDVERNLPLPATQFTIPYKLPYTTKSLVKFSCSEQQVHLFVIQCMSLPRLAICYLLMNQINGFMLIIGMEFVRR